MVFGKSVALAASAALCMAGAASAADEPPLQASYPTDGAMSCDQLSAESARMEQIMGIASNSAAKAGGAGRAAELGTSVAINGALYSGALGAVPGAGLLANGVGMFAKRSAASKKKQAEERVRTAETRRAIVSGLYQGKNCAAQSVSLSTVAEAATPQR